MHRLSLFSRRLTKLEPYWRLILAMVVLSLASLVFRRMSLSSESIQIRTLDFRGALEDLAFGGLLAGLISLVPTRVQKGLLLLATLAVGLVAIGNFEHIRSNYSSLEFGFVPYLFDRTFFQGSVAEGFNPLLMLIGLIIPVGLATRVRTPFVRSRRERAAATGLIVAGSLLGIVPVQVEFPGWRQSNVFYENGRQYSHEISQLIAAPSQSEAISPLIQSMFKTDLSGKSRWPGAKKAKNILLVTVEGMPQAFLDGQRSSVDGSATFMPFLSQLMKESVSFSNMVAHQRQTNRGQYSILCGDFPNMAQLAPKMSLYFSGERRVDECLPAYLNHRGYQTVYLQSAPIGFMQKDKFMNAAGFDMVLDTKWFDGDAHHFGWGVDDASFFRGASKLIQELSEEGAPWFLNLMTSGTHHPYALPEGNTGRSGLGVHEDAFLYLDEALQTFISELKRTGRLQDTMVIITSDESSGFSHPDPLADQLTQNHIPFIVLMPDNPVEKIDEVYSQSDVALSIADYVGLNNESPFFKGRSLFRQYDTTRPVPFANVYSARAYMLWNHDEFTVCDNKIAKCQDYRGDLFQGPYEGLGVNSEHLSDLRSFVRLNDWQPENALFGRYSLMQDTSVTFKKKSVNQTLFLSPYLSLGPGAVIEVHLKVKGTAGTSFFSHDVVAAGASVTLQKFPKVMLQSGMKYELRYRMFLREKLDGIELRGIVENKGSDLAGYEIEEASYLIEKGIPRNASGTVEVLKMGIASDAGVHVFDGAMPGFFNLMGCEDHEGGMRLLRRCRDVAAFGPYTFWPKGTKITVEAVVKGDPEGDLFLDFADQQGRQVLAKTSVLSSIPKEGTRLKLTHELQEDANAFETRLHTAERDHLDIAFSRMAVEFPSL